MARVEGNSRPLKDGPAVPAELVFLAVMGALLALLALAGVPLLDEPVAGDGSERLRRGWAESLGTGQPDSQQALQEQLRALELTPSEPLPLPSGRGREPDPASR